MEPIIDYIKPELLVLIPVCWGLGMLLKAIPIPGKDWIIPLSLALCAIGLALLYILGMGEYTNALTAAFAAVTQGVLTWLIAWVSYDRGIKRLQAGEDPHA